jgi:uncharacterized coiled-coil protein SlyX
MLILHYQRDFAALSEVVLEQARAADHLRREVTTFNERLKYWRESSEQTTGEEPPPPHY